MTKNSFWVKFEEFGFYYRVKDNLLKQAPINDDGTIMIDDKTIVSSISDEFQQLSLLEKINQEFGSSFCYDDFTI
jgi:hypothetical protein